MKDFERKLLSSICAMSMAISSAGSLVVTAAEDDNDFGRIEMSGIPNAGAIQKSVEEVKAEIAGLADVTFGNYNTLKTEVLSIVADVNALTDEEREALNVPMDDSMSDTYWKKINKAANIVEAGPVYEYFRDTLPSEPGYDYISNITADNYKENYGVIDEAGVLYDTLSAGAQRELGNTPYGQKWVKAVLDFERFWNADVSLAVTLLNKVVTDKTEITADNYGDCAADLNNAKVQYNALLEDQKPDVDDGIPKLDADGNPVEDEDGNIIYTVPPLGKSAEGVLADGQAALDDFKADSISTVSDMVAEDITLENCEAVKASAERARTEYDNLAAKVDGFGDAALSARITNLIEAAKYFINVKAIGVDSVDDLNSSNYMAKKSTIDAVAVMYDDLSDEQKAMSDEAHNYAENAAAIWSEFKAALIEAAKNAVDAIGTFDYDTWKDTNAWTQVGQRLTDANNAINAVDVSHRAEITDYINTYNDKKALYDEINENYAQATNVRNLINAIGTVGAIATDSITLSSEAAITAAENAYAALTSDQQGLIATEYANLQTARAEYDELKAQADAIRAKVDSFKAAVEAIDLGYLTALTNEEIETKVSDAEALYDAAKAMAEDETYGEKLKSLVSEELNIQKEALRNKADKLVDLRNKGEAVITNGDALFDKLNNLCTVIPTCAGITVDENTDRDDIQTLLNEALSYCPDDIDEVNNLLTAMSSAVNAYNISVDAIEAVAGNVPDAEPYRTYAKYADQYSVINAELEAINPSEVISKVDEWAENVAYLFENVEDSCIENLDNTIAQYDALYETMENFSEAETAYMNRQKPVALSNLYYINTRIFQYQKSADYIRLVDSIIENFDGIDEYRAQYGEDSYRNKLSAICTDVENSNAKFNDLEPAIQDINRVDEQYMESNNIKKQCEKRITAYDEFDKKVAELLAGITNEDGIIALPGNIVLSELLGTEFKNLWLKYASFDADVKDLVTKADELCEAELSLIENVITKLDSITNTELLKDAVAEANISVAAFTTNRSYYGENVKISEENINKLNDYNTAIEYYSDVEAIAAELTEDNWADYKADIESLAALYEETELAAENAQRVVDEAYAKLNKLRGKLVSYMIADLPVPSEIEEYTTIEELEAIRDMLEAVDDAYNQLAIEDKLDVEGYARYELGVEAYKTAMANYNKVQANAVDESIRAIGYYDENGSVTMKADNYQTYGESIDEAKEEYDALTDEQRAYVTEGRTLTAAIEDYNSWSEAAANAVEVIAMINNLPEEITDDNYADVRAAWEEANEAFRDLTAREAEFVSDELSTRLNDIDSRLSFVEGYMEVVNAIQEDLYDSEVYSNIVNNSAINIEYGVRIAEIESMFNNLERAQKLCVSNYVVLFEARNAYNANIEQTITAIQTAIDGFDLDNLTTGDQEAVDNTEYLINLLTESNQERIGADRLEKFEAVKAKMRELKTVDEVIALIDAIGDIEELNRDNYIEKCALIQEARNGYETLSVADKQEVTNYVVLVEWERAVAEFNADYSGDLNKDGVVDINDIYKMVQIALGKVTPSAEEFELANIVKEDNGADEVIDIFDVLAAIDKIDWGI